MKTATWTAAIVLCALNPNIACQTAQAAEFAKEGLLDATQCFDGEGNHFQITDDVNFGAMVNRGVIHANKPTGHPMDFVGSLCVVVYNANKHGKSGANGHCTSTDADGDKYITSFSDEGNAMSGRFESVAGTGKYQGARIVGEFKPLSPLFFVTPGRMQRCMHVTGTFRLR